MTPIGSTSSNIRRAIEFIVHSYCSPAPLADTHDQLDGCAQPISSHDDDRRFTWRSRGGRLAGGIITNTVIISATVGGHTAVFWDIALRDFGLMLAALALARLAAVYAPERLFHSRRSARAIGTGDVR